MIGQLSVLVAGRTLFQDGFEIEVIPKQKLCKVPGLWTSSVSSPSIFQHGRDIIFCGGHRYVIECWKLDYKNAEWTYFNSMLYNRVTEKTEVVSMSSKTYLLGGSTYTDASEILEHNSDSWKEGPEVPPSKTLD